MRASARALGGAAVVEAEAEVEVCLCRQPYTLHYVRCTCAACLPACLLPD